MNSNIVVSFDLDDTLYDNTPVIRFAFTALYEHLVARYPRFSKSYPTVNLFIKSAAASRQRYLDEFDFQRIRHLHIADSLNDAGYNDVDTNDAYQVFYDARQNVTLFDDTLETLSALQKNYQLISISNGNAEPARIGLGEFFRQHFNPHISGYAKPDPQLYLWVCQRLQIEPQQLVHIGDCLENDVAAAKAAGCQTIWYNPQAQPYHDGYSVERLADLPELLPFLL